MIAKITDLGVIASRFPILSVFAASVPSLLLGQFFLFVPEDSLFFFLGHRIIELGIVFSRMTPCTMWMYVCVFVRRFRLTARIHINVLNFSFFLVFHDRGKISQIFPCWRGFDFVGFFPGYFPLRVAGPVQRSLEIESSFGD